LAACKQTLNVLLPQSNYVEYALTYKIKRQYPYFRVLPNTLYWLCIQTICNDGEKDDHIIKV